MSTKDLDKCSNKVQSGFTLLEVMISIAFFGLIMIYVSQILNQDIRSFNSASRLNDLQHNTRSAMMHIIDELRFHHSKSVVPVEIPGVPIEENVRIFGSTSTTYCLICTDQTGISSEAGIFAFYDEDSNYKIPIIIYFDKSTKELWYQENNQKKLLLDQVKSLKFVEAAGVLNIELEAEDPSINQSFKLVSAIRLL